MREAGVTIVFDARKVIPQPQLYKALMTLQVRSTESSKFSVGVYLGPECSFVNKLL